MTTPTRPLAERLDAFARRAQQAGCALEIHHQSRGMVARIDVGEALPSGAELESMAADHASSLHGRQAYELRAVYPEGAAKQTMPFRIDGSAREGEELPEAANEKGLLATVCRQNDNLLRAFERVHKPLIDGLDAMGRLLAQHQAQHAAMLKTQLELATLQYEREERRDQAMASDRRWAAIFERFGPLATAITARLMPGSVVSASVLEDFAKSLSQDQIAHIMMQLTEEQQVLASAGRWQELLTSVVDGPQFGHVVTCLRPEQVAMVDAFRAGRHTNGAPKGRGGVA